MADTPTLIRFVPGFEPKGVGPDGLPLYEEVVRIYLSRPPYLEVDRPATEADFEEYPHPYKLYQQENKGKRMTGKEGYPLVMWPAVAPHEIKMCADREIYTVEQLSKLAGKSADQVPGAIIELAKRAKRMIELSKETGKHEARIHDLEGQIGVVREDNNNLKAALEAANLKITMLLSRPAA